MTIYLIISGIIILIGILFFIYIRNNSKPQSAEKAAENIETILRKELAKGKNLSDIQVLIESGEKHFSGKFIFNRAQKGDRPFHVASVGKSFTATIIGLLVDEGKLKFEDLLSDYLPKEVLKGLFVFHGVDYQNKVTVKQLLGHTSGIADYFEDKAVGSDSMKDLILKEKDRMWKPMDLIDFTRNYQKAVSRPGVKYHYSDTGYILLGLLIEKVSGKTFERVLHERLFKPLKMDHSYLMFYSEPENGDSQLNDIWLQGHEISTWNSLSIDWTGGGIVSTLDDLKIFIHALNNYKLVSESTLNEMYTFDNKFTVGIYYGLGFMQYKFSDYFPTLGKLPALRGHMGVLGTQLFYDKETDTTVIMNFGSTDYTSKSVRLMIPILMNVFRISR